MDDLDFELLQAKALEAESRGQIARGRAGLPPPGWSPARVSPARAAELAMSDHAAVPGTMGAGGSVPQSNSPDRFGKLNGTLSYLLDRLESRILRSGPPPKPAAARKAPVLHLYGFDEPVEVQQPDQQQDDGPRVPFRLTEAKLCREKTGSGIYFGRLSMQVTTVSVSTVALFS
eukprot:gb/GFBE01055032.1/.p1 GENE.gb/GFBE01055032.1/~~gb/GFBE01055032.1/.p1  ORF type:complete len:174 (+),score=24.84 gb/GFBE01055032.1/:1-522(+)